MMRRWAARRSTRHPTYEPHAYPGGGRGAHGVPAPLLGCDVAQRLVEHPLVPERVIYGGLSLAVLPVVGRIDDSRLPCHRSLDHACEVGDLQHYLVRSLPLRCSPSRTNLCHDQLCRRPVRQTELRAMPLADTDVFDETEDLDVPRYGHSDVGHGEDRGHSSVRRRPVCEHTVRLDCDDHPAQSPSRSRAAQSGRGYTEPPRLNRWRP